MATFYWSFTLQMCMDEGVIIIAKVVDTGLLAQK